MKHPIMDRKTFKDVDGFTAVSPTGEREFRIYNKEAEYVGFYSDKHKAVLIIGKTLEEPELCNSLHQAVRWVYLQTQRPIQKQLAQVKS